MKKIYIFSIALIVVALAIFRNHFSFYNIDIICSLFRKNNIDHMPEQIHKMNGQCFKTNTHYFEKFGHPRYIFNPSLIDYKGKRMMTFRLQGFDGQKRRTSEIYIAEVDAEFRVVWAKPLTLKKEEIEYEDARLFMIGETLYASCVHSSLSKGKYASRVAIGEVDKDFNVKEWIVPNIDNNNSDQPMQKNWLVFEHEKKCIIVNWLDPMSIWDATSFQNPKLIETKPAVIKDWKYGQIRASTNPIYIANKDQYICFYHSSLEMRGYFKRRIYYIGAILMDKKLNIIAHTKEPLLKGTSQIKPLGRSYDTLPYGAILEKNEIILSIGLNDVESWIAKIPIERIFSQFKN
jgi:predicted GH43/DUF377 family glycosyl hydrolase